MCNKNYINYRYFVCNIVKAIINSSGYIHENLTVKENADLFL